MTQLIVQHFLHRPIDFKFLLDVITFPIWMFTFTKPGSNLGLVFVIFSLNTLLFATWLLHLLQQLKKLTERKILGKLLFMGILMSQRFDLFGGL